jgi:hypothetical protein
MLIFYLLESLIRSEAAEILLTCAHISVCGYCFHSRKCFEQDHLTQSRQSDICLYMFSLTHYIFLHISSLRTVT